MTSFRQTGSIVEGALMASLTAILALVGIYLPILRIFTNLVWTIPIVLATVRHGLSTGIMSIVVAGLLIFSLSSPLEAVFLVLQFGGLALVYGYAFHKKWRPGLTLLSGAAVAMVSVAMVFALSLLVVGVEAGSILEQLKEGIEPTIELYKQLGFFERYAAQGLTEEAARDMLTAIINQITLVIPALLVLYGLMSAFINYFVAQKILLRLKTPVPQLPPFIKWQLPWWTVWGFIAGYGANLAGAFSHQQTLSTIGSNIMFVYFPVLFILGLAVVSFFINKHFPGVFIYRLVFLLFVFFFFQYAAWFLSILGLVDLIFNYRRLSGEH